MSSEPRREKCPECGRMVAVRSKGSRAGQLHWHHGSEPGQRCVLFEREAQLEAIQARARAAGHPDMLSVVDLVVAMGAEVHRTRARAARWKAAARDYRRQLVALREQLAVGRRFVVVDGAGRVEQTRSTEQLRASREAPGYDGGNRRK